MGVTGLLTFIKRFGKQCNLRLFSGQTVAIDGSCWIHKGLYVSINQADNREGYVYKTNILLYFYIIPSCNVRLG